MTLNGISLGEQQIIDKLDEILKLLRAQSTGLPQQVECDHCGYVSDYETKRLGEVGASGAWICPSCVICNTTYHLDIGFRTELGYSRDLEVGFL